eukprot:s172_g9.t1
MTSSSFWLVATLCTWQMTQVRSEGDQCGTKTSEKEMKFEAQTAVIYIISATCMFLCLAVWYLWKCLRGMQHLVETMSRQPVQPLLTANLVERMLQSENNIAELQIQLNETLGDIDTIYRTLRRRASPHPEERSTSRPRIMDSHPAQPEPDAEDGDLAEEQPEGNEHLMRRHRDHEMTVLTVPTGVEKEMLKKVMQPMMAR